MERFTKGGSEVRGLHRLAQETILLSSESITGHIFQTSVCLLVGATLQCQHSITKLYGYLS